jgi:hypothetical protein
VWDKLQHPYWISFIAIDALKEDVDYKKIIAPLKLRQWALTTKFDGIRVLAHPIHKAKVGFAPEGEQYEFDEPGVVAAPGDASSSAEKAQGVPAKVSPRLFSTNRTRRSTLQFLETLSNLSDEELDSITIPVRTIVRLLHG